MSDNKIKEMKDKVVGKVKEETGKLTGNEELEIEGKIQQGVGKAREVVEDVKDNVFAQEIMGPTVAIKPHNNDVYAPVSGEIIMFSDTKHALGIRTKSGLEVLIHIGIDTVKLNGEPFSSTLEVGDTVNHGDLITTVDLDYLKERNVDNTIIIAITNYNQLNKLIDANTKVTNQSAILQTSI